MLVYPRANPAKWWKSPSVGQGHRSPRAMFVSPLRRFTSLTSLLVVGGLVGGVWYFTNSKRISAMSEALLSRVLGGQVRVGSGHLSFSGSLRLSDVTLQSPGTSGPGAVLFSADQLEVRFEWLSLLTGQLRAQQLVAIRPTLNLVQDKDKDQWNYEQLINAQPATKPGEPPAPTNPLIQLPSIILREAKVQWGEISNGKYRLAPPSVIDGRLQPDPTAPQVYDLAMEQRTEHAAPGVALTGTWNVATNRFSAVMNNVSLDQRLKNSLPFQVRQWWDDYQVSGNLKSLRTTVDPSSGRTVEVRLDNISMRIPLADDIVPVNKVSGMVTFSDHGVHVTDLGGAAFGEAFVVDDAAFDGYSIDATFAIHLRLPALHLTGDYPAIVRNSQIGSGVIERLRPIGLVSAAATITRTRFGGDVAVNGAVDVLDVNARFVHFPYPMRHLHGRMKFDNDFLEFVRMDGFAEENPVHFKGRAGISDISQMINVDVWSEHARLDDRLASCLQADIRTAWDQFHPTGDVSFQCNVSRKDDESGDPLVNLHVHALDVGGAYEGMPYPLHHLHGDLSFGPTKALITELAGPVGNTPGSSIRFAGTVDYPDGNFAGVAPRVSIVGKNIRLEQKLVDALPDEYKKWIDRLQPSGLVGIDGLITRGPDGEPQVTGDLTLSSALLRPRGAPWAISNVHGLATVSPGKIALKYFDGNTGQDQTGKVSVNAVIDTTTPDKATLQSQCSWSNIVLPSTVPPHLPPAILAKWDTWKPAGPVDGDLDFALHFDNSLATPEHIEINKAPATPSTGSQTRPSLASLFDHLTLRLRPRGMSVSPAFFPEPLRDINGNLTITPEKVTLDALSAHAGPMRVSVQGVLHPPTAGVDVSATVKADAIPSKGYALLPQKAADMLTPLHADGKFDLAVDSLTHDAIGWGFQANLNVPELKMRGSRNFGLEDLALKARGSWDPAGGRALDLDAQLAAGQLLAAGHALQNVSARIISTKASHALALTDLQGKIADGSLEGNLLLKLAPKTQYEGKLTISEARLATLVNPEHPAQEAKKLGPGRVSAELSLAGMVGDPASRTGRGSLVVHDATLFHVPLAMGLLQLATLRLPVSGAFHSADIGYYVQNNQVTFEHILLGSPGINLAGLGTMNLNDHALDLQFVTESPHPLFTLPIFSQLLSTTRDQLMQVHVTGTADKPNVEPMPLNGLTSVLRRLLPGAGQKAETR